MNYKEVKNMKVNLYRIGYFLLVFLLGVFLLAGIEYAIMTPFVLLLVLFNDITFWSPLMCLVIINTLLMLYVVTSQHEMINQNFEEMLNEAISQGKIK